jgi:hypothetical protein
MKTQITYTHQLSYAQKQMAVEMLKLPRKYQWEIVPGKETAIIADVCAESRYKNGKWKTVTRADHRASLTSYSVVSKNGRQVKHFKTCGLTGKVETSTERVPVGYKLDQDKLGLRIVRVSDGRDYHPDYYQRLKPITTWVTSMESLDQLRDKQALEQALETLAIREARNTRVTLQDSRRAGNCAAGSLTFAKRLGYDEGNVHGINVPGVRGDVLLRTGDERAKAAVIAAYARETIVII